METSGDLLYRQVGSVEQHFYREYDLFVYLLLGSCAGVAAYDDVEVVGRDVKSALLKISRP